jgi:glycosyltransferase involved in cell wall biosynthesis
MNSRNNIVNESESISLVHPFVIPLHDSKIVRRINAFFLARKLSKALKKSDFKKPILITSTPIIADLIGQFDEALSIYFCLDDYSLFSGAFKSIGYLELKLMNKIDVVFSISEKLLNTRIPKSGNSIFLPQGVDIDHFTITDSKNNNLTESSTKVIGFFGLLSTWVDIDLLVKCAKAYKDYEFLIIGKSEQRIDDLVRQPNVNYLGAVPYEKLPGIAKRFDVGLIPFLVNDLTIAVNPIKLIEYFALGIPVVSTSLPEVKKFKELVFIADNEEKFIEYISNAIDDNNPDRNNLRKKKALEYSWESISEKISNKIIEVIENEK